MKLISLAIATLALRLSFPFVAAAGTKSLSFADKLYRAGGAGRILVSSDGGSTWKLHTDLGDIYAVTQLAVDRRNRLRVTVAFDGRLFELFLATDQKRWLTT